MVQVVLIDITQLEVDVIVNAANSQLMVGGGVDFAIHQAAGPGLKNEVDSQSPYLEPGEVLLTSGYRLPAKYVIHTVAPRWEGGHAKELEILADCYSNSINLAIERNLKSIAFPALGTGAFRIPIEQAARVAIQAVANSDADESGLEVILCCYSPEDYELYVSTCEAMIEEAETADELPPCILCFWQLKPIVYGLVAPSPDDDFISGGCSIMPDAPTLGCKNCGWEGTDYSLNWRDRPVFFAVLDEQTNSFAGGASYFSGNPKFFEVLAPGWPASEPSTLEAMQKLWSGAQKPSLWIGTEDSVVDGALKPLLLDLHLSVTPEVMKFIGFKRASDYPRFLD